ncbi:MAG: CPBP family intramembrane metalloprotease [Verrucomicrobia bacterium]|nr:CPBP family intramembrane metalloprotease [Verrucomicrobiota bacterium]
MERRRELYEFLVVLFLIIPSMVISYFVVQRISPSFDIIANATILRDLSLVALVAYFLWRNQESVSQIGWTHKGIWKEIALGIVLYLVMLIAIVFLEEVLQRAGFTLAEPKRFQFLHPKGTLEILLAILLVVVVAFVEETIFRGYMLLRLIPLTKSRVTAVLISSFIFAMGHTYEGMAAVFIVGLMGAFFAIIYLWRRSLVAPIIMHFLQDFYGIVVIPLQS